MLQLLLQWILILGMDRGKDAPFTNPVKPPQVTLISRSRMAAGMGSRDTPKPSMDKTKAQYFIKTSARIREKGVLSGGSHNETPGMGKAF
jgi:hypothetical protein